MDHQQTLVGSVHQPRRAVLVAGHPQRRLDRGLRAPMSLGQHELTPTVDTPSLRASILVCCSQHGEVAKW